MLDVGGNFHCFHLWVTDDEGINPTSITHNMNLKKKGVPTKKKGEAASTDAAAGWSYYVL